MNTTAPPRLEGFEVGEIVGRGRSAVVYRAWDIGRSRTVVVKLLTLALPDDARRWFEWERRITRSVPEHPALAAIYTAGTDQDGRPYQVMEHLGGGTLATRIASGPQAWTGSIGIGVALSGGLETLHRRGLLHRDIRPEQVLLSWYGDPKLADYGTGAAIAAARRAAGGQPWEGDHQAPEVRTGGAPTAASDQWSLAALVARLLRGALEGPVPAAVGQVLGRAVAADPQLRFPSVAEFGAALAEAAGGAVGAPAVVDYPDPALVEAVLPPGTVRTPPDAAAPGWAAAAAAGEEVDTALCPRRHPNRPDVPYCSSCGVPVVASSSTLVRAIRPKIGVLRFDDGSGIDVEGILVIGREPHTHERIAAGGRAVTLADPALRMSRAHVSVSVDGWDPVVEDLASVNGTFAAMVGDEEWTKVPAGEPLRLRPYQRVVLGTRWFTYEPA